MWVIIKDAARAAFWFTLTVLNIVILAFIIMFATYHMTFK